MTVSIPDDQSTVHAVAREFVISLSKLGLLERTARLQTVVEAGSEPGDVSLFARSEWSRAFGSIIPHEVVWHRAGATPAGAAGESLQLTAYDAMGVALMTRSYEAAQDVGLALREDDGLPVSKPVSRPDCRRSET